MTKYSEHAEMPYGEVGFRPYRNPSSGEARTEPGLGDPGWLFITDVPQGLALCKTKRGVREPRKERKRTSRDVRGRDMGGLSSGKRHILGTAGRKIIATGPGKREAMSPFGLCNK